ncbi:MAG: prolyl oligopeptidase family serine peptidase, partial [Bacteroides sp.]|uniref:alpha/beta hydrolase family protein n=1 Tax=Bacteroides sp. TaxID=29523 RepID=UPI002FC7681C
HTAIFSRIVSHCGVFDLSTYPDECLGKRKDVMLGYTNCCEETEYKTRIADISPNHFVDNWNVPILLIHAIDDTTVWFGQSVRAYNKAVERNKNVKLMLTPGAHTYHIKGAHSLFNEIIHFALKPV